MVYASGGVITASDYNSFVDDINKLFGSGTGDFGYGGNTTAVPVVDLPYAVSGTTVKNEDWLNLRNAIQSVADHQGTTLTDTLPDVILLEDGDVGSFFSALNSSTNLSDLTNNRFNVSGAPTISASVLTSSRSLAWHNIVQHRFSVRFNDSDHARLFFNTGGSIKISATRTGGGATSQNTAWTTLVDNNSPFTFSRADYFLLTNTLTTIQEFTLPSGLYSPSAGTSNAVVWTINAKRDDSEGLNNGNGSVLIFESSFNDRTTNAPDTIDGTFTSDITEHKYDSVFTNIVSPTYADVGPVITDGI